LCLIALVPGALKFASTGKDLSLEAGGYKQTSLMMPLGFFSLGFQLIGLIVLWTGYKRNERWAWFVMLVILLFFVFPPSALTLLLSVPTPEFEWSYWLRGIREGYLPAIWMGLGTLDFLVMLVALLIPVRSFFARSAGQNTLNM